MLTAFTGGPSLFFVQNAKQLHQPTWWAWSRLAKWEASELESTESSLVVTIISSRPENRVFWDDDGNAGEKYLIQFDGMWSPFPPNRTVMTMGMTIETIGISPLTYFILFKGRGAPQVSQASEERRLLHAHFFFRTFVTFRLKQNIPSPIFLKEKQISCKIFIFIL